MRYVPSYRLNSSMRGVLAAVAVAIAAGVTSAPATADPAPPTNTNDAANQLRDLSHQAEVLTEQYKKAEDDHSARLGELTRATGDAKQAERATSQARTEEQNLRVQSDRFVRASFEGARIDQMSAMLLSKSPRDYLDGASALDALSKEQADVVLQFQAATDRAAAAERQTQDARDRAARAEADAARIQNDLGAKKTAMDAQIGKAKTAYNALSAKDKSALDGASDAVNQIAGSGAAAQAVNSALSKVGDPYVWGATGPSQFDCSGLVQWAYKQAGVSLSRSTYSQVEAGRSVSEGQLQPGDLVFFYSDYSHVGIYVGGGKVVHAPTEGENVKVTPYKYIGQVTAMRRVAG